MKTVPKPPHCGVCDPNTRQREDDEGRPSRCPACHPLLVQPPEPQAPISGPETADTLWMGACRQIIRQLAAEGRPFAAEDVAARGLGEPSNPNHWGLAFQGARRAREIAPHDITISPRGSRRGGTRRVWVGAAYQRLAS